MKVVITRDADDGGRFARALGARFEVVFAPVTAIAPATTEELGRLHACAGRIAAYHHVFVASRHAVPPLVAALSAAGSEAATAPPVTAVGPATAAALVAAGFDARAEGDTGEAAAAALAPRVRGRRVLAPRAAGGRDEPLAILRAAGAEVDDVVAYRQVAAGAAEVADGLAALRGGAAACLLFAPSQVAALDALLAPDGGLAGLAGGTALVAIGPTTAAALAAHGVVAAAVAAAPTPEAMAKALASVYPDVA